MRFIGRQYVPNEGISLVRGKCAVSFVEPERVLRKIARAKPQARDQREAGKQQAGTQILEKTIHAPSLLGGAILRNPYGLKSSRSPHREPR